MFPRVSLSDYFDVSLFCADGGKSMLDASNKIMKTRVKSFWDELKTMVFMKLLHQPASLCLSLYLHRLTPGSLEENEQQDKSQELLQ